MSCGAAGAERQQPGPLATALTTSRRTAAKRTDRHGVLRIIRPSPRLAASRAAAQLFQATAPAGV